MIFVTSYDSPDLDGIACMIAYAELLNKQGKKAKAVYYGTLGLEVEFVKKYTNYFPVEKCSEGYGPDAHFVLVDTADPEAIEPGIAPEKVTEIFDHHTLAFPERFVNAAATIELVGSCATLVVERFRREKMELSPNAARYLYSAIISNTVNFKNSVSTERDKNAARYLASLVSIPEDYIKRMFESKSAVSSDNIDRVISQDFAIRTVHGKRVGIAQIEVADLESIVNGLRSDLTATLERLKEENKLEFVFFTGIDILEGYNIFMTIDDASRSLFSEALHIPNLESEHKTDSILMRKQIWPEVEVALAGSAV